jgi:hypothetical protein
MGTLLFLSTVKEWLITFFNQSNSWVREAVKIFAEELYNRLEFGGRKFWLSKYTEY